MSDSWLYSNESEFEERGNSVWRKLEKYEINHGYLSSFVFSPGPFLQTTQATYVTWKVTSDISN